jgi:hypothetical protein
MRLAVALMNFGPDMAPGGSFEKRTSVGTASSDYEGFAPATEFKFGIALQPITRPWLDTVVDFELAHPADNSETFRLGGEAVFSRTLAVRAGHDFKADAMQTSLGVGATAGFASVAAQFDYAATMTEYLGTIHRFSIRLGLR